MLQAHRAAAVHVGDARGDGEERLQALDVVARVGDDLRIGRRLRAAIDLVQLVEICGAVERRRISGIVAETVFAQHAVPAAAIVGRLDQRIGAVAQLALLIGGAEFGDRPADRDRRVAADPVMHVVADELGPDASEIAVQHAAAGQAGRRKKQDERDCPPMTARHMKRARAGCHEISLQAEALLREARRRRRRRWLRLAVPSAGSCSSL